MVRTYKPKTERNKINEDDIKTAISEVVSKTLSIRAAANKYNIHVSTLQHRIERFKLNVENRAVSRGEYSSKYTVSQVFTAEQEKQLAEYLINCSKMHHGLTLKQTMVLAYEYAGHLGCKYPDSWKVNGFAGKDWVRGFRKRNESISLRKPENTSAARSFGFNKTAVTEFFDNYERVLTQHKFTPDRILNLDETGITTVLPTPKVLAEKTLRQVGQIASAERGELVTFCGIVTAIGTALPPVFVFPRVHYKEHFINGAPEGSLGLANRSGWMTAELHIQVLKHIQRHTLCTVESPILIICDNHESHISIEAVNYCRSNGIVYLSLPPHTSHKMQPLDIAIFGPFKGKLKIAFNDWHTGNVGKTLTIYKIAELTKTAFMEAFTPKNITSGFSKPGIWPFNRLAFSSDDFAPLEIYTSTTMEIAEASNQDMEEPSFINLDDNNHIDDNEQPALPAHNTDPLETSNQLRQTTVPEYESSFNNTSIVPSSSVTSTSVASSTVASASVASASVASSSVASASVASSSVASASVASSSVASASVASSSVASDSVASSSVAIMSPEVVRPYPKKKHMQCTSTNRGRVKGKSRVFTDTPEKNRLQSEYEEKEKKQQLKIMRQKAKELKTAKKLLGITNISKTKTTKKRRRSLLPDSDSSQTASIILSDDEAMDILSELDKSDDDIHFNDPGNIKVNDFLLVKFAKKKSVVYYVAKVINIYSVTEYQVLYLRKKPGSLVFVFPPVEDKASVDFNEVVLHLPKPIFTKGTSRTSELYKFSVDLSQYNVQ